jgi:hypothetical protein
MPEDQKPSGRSMPKIPFGKVALIIVLAGIVVLAVLTGVSIMQQGAFVR